MNEIRERLRDGYRDGRFEPAVVRRMLISSGLTVAETERFLAGEVVFVDLVRRR